MAEDLLEDFGSLLRLVEMLHVILCYQALYFFPTFLDLITCNLVYSLVCLHLYSALYWCDFLFLVVNEDYTLSNTSIILFREPTPISVTLLNDGVAGEGLEIITLTLIQTFGPENDGIILGYNTTVIHLWDIYGKSIIFRVVGHTLRWD